MNESLFSFEYIKKTFKNKIIIVRFILVLITLLIIVTDIIYINNLYIKLAICILPFYIFIYNITAIFVAYLDLRINGYKQQIYQHICDKYNELLEYRKEYNTKYIETKEFNDMFNILISSNKKSEIIDSCTFFRKYNRFGCKDPENKFIATLFVYIYGIEKLDEKHILMHRNLFNHEKA